MRKITIIVLISLFALYNWFVYTDKPISFILLEDNMCRNDEVEVKGTCKVFMVKNFSQWHKKEQLEQIKTHALHTTRNSGEENVYYFKDCSWTQENRKSFHFKPINEIARWDESISIFLPIIPYAFICRV